MAIEKNKKEKIILMASLTILECNIASSLLAILQYEGFKK